MSGIVRVRKQWHVQEGPHGTLRKLRSQLAEDGCCESQVVVAKHLLEEAEDSDDWIGNTSRAVYWLMKASEQGNEEATSLLKKCFKSGTGITEDNLEIVKASLTMPDEEKAFRAAARNLFTVLTPFGQEFVTTLQLRSKLKDLTHGETDATLASSNSEDNNGSAEDKAEASFSKWYREGGLFEGEYLTEDNLTQIASKISNGSVPNVSLETNDNLLQKGSENFLKMVLNRLRYGLNSSVSRAFRSVANQGDQIIMSLLPLQQLRTIFLVLFFSLTSLETMWFILPLLLFYSSLTAMIISTLQLLYYSCQYNTFRLWLQIFVNTDPELNVRCAEKKFWTRRLRHYKWFLLSFVVMLLIYPLSSFGGILFSEITVICGGLTLLSMIGLNTFTPQIWSFAVVSSLLTVVRILSITEQMTALKFLEPLTGLFSDMEIDTLDPIIINASISYLIILILILICFWIAATDSWHGTYKSLLPNLVVLTWMQLIVIFFPNSSWLGLVRGSAIFVAVILLPAVLIIALTSLLIYVLVWLMNFLWLSPNAVTYLCTLGVIGISVLGRWLVSRRETLNKVLWKRSLTSVQVACGIYAIFHLLTSFQDIHLVVNKSGRDVNHLNWSTYQELCHVPAWNKFSTATVQDSCHHFVGASVFWEGLVRSVKITAVHNNLEDILSVLPTSLTEHLRCVYGVKYEDCQQDEMTTYTFKWCSVLQHVMNQKCHVNNFNKYDFEITVQISGGYWNSADVVLVADHSYTDFMLQLQSGDIIKFTGHLYKHLGGLNPVVKLKNVTCVDCASDIHFTAGSKPVYVQDYFSKVYTSVFNYLFNPFMHWKSN